MKKIKYKNLIILLPIFLYAVYASNCTNDNSSNPNSNGIVHIDNRGDCLSLLSSTETDSGYMVLEVDGNDLKIRHMGAYYQCCLLYTVDYTIDNYDLTAVESDTGQLCDCYCYFNLESDVYGLKGGLYYVTLMGIFGDIVGVDTITVGG